MKLTLAQSHRERQKQAALHSAKNTERKDQRDFDKDKKKCALRTSTKEPQGEEKYSTEFSVFFL